MNGAANVLIVGAGQAAAQAAQSRRQGGYTGVLTIVGDKTALPYQRPSMLKARMKGEFEEERLYIRSAS